MPKITLRCWEEVYVWCDAKGIFVDIVREPTKDDPWPLATYEAERELLLKMIGKFWDGSGFVIEGIEE